MDSFDPEIAFANIDDACRIYGDDRAEICALVDAIDFPYLSQWLWSPKRSRGNNKVYLRRNVQYGLRSCRIQRTLYLHQAVMALMGAEPPTPLHTVIDHRNGNGLDCRRANLRWATYSMNRLNINGSHGHDLVEG